MKNRRHYRTACVVMLMIALHAAVFASSPSEYKERLETVQSTIEALLVSIDDLTPQVERDAFAQMERTLPATELIEWPGGSIETDNRWLGEQLGLLRDPAAEDERATILTAISERLAAIHRAVEQLEAAAAGDMTKDQDKQKLAEILRREEFLKPQPAEQSLFQRWLDEFLKWLSSAFPRPSIPEGASPGLGSLAYGLQILIYGLVIAVIGFLLYKIAPFISRRFRAGSKSSSGPRVILGERIAADESAEDLFGEAERLAREGNLRAAIRKGYIALLCDLSDRGVIRLAHHKTNRDYIRDLRKDAELLDNVRGLTGAFERNWYGLRNAEQADWDDFRMRYMQAIASVKR